METWRADSLAGSRTPRGLPVASVHGVIAACVLCASALSAADATLEERFRKEAPEKWLEYRRIVARHTEGRSKSSVLITLGDEKVHEGVLEWSFALNVDGTRASARIVNSEDGKRQSVEAFNPQYAFDLKPARAEQWAIGRLRTGSTALPDDLIGRDAHRPLVMGEVSVFGSAMQDPCAGQMLGGAWLPRMVESPDFQVKRVTAVGREGFVKVEFAFEPKEKTGGAATARSGTVVLDTKRYWLIREADTEASGNFASKDQLLEGVRGTLTVRNKLTSANMRVPYVSRQVCTEAYGKATGGKPWKSVTESTLEMRDVPEMDEKQFRLSGYGLPEPPAKK